jgi:hypothetical protein
MSSHKYGDEYQNYTVRLVGPNPGRLAIIRKSAGRDRTVCFIEKRTQWEAFCTAIETGANEIAAVFAIGAADKPSPTNLDVKKVDHLERLNSSVNGNPRFHVYFTDGTDSITSSDAAFCYGIENPDMRGAVVVSFTRAGRIADMRPATDEVATKTDQLESPAMADAIETVVNMSATESEPAPTETYAQYLARAESEQASGTRRQAPMIESVWTALQDRASDAFASSRGPDGVIGQDADYLDQIADAAESASVIADDDAERESEPANLMRERYYCERCGKPTLHIGDVCQSCPRYIVRGTDHAQDEPDTVSRPEVYDTRAGSSVSGPWALNDWDRAEAFARGLNRVGHDLPASALSAESPDEIDAERDKQVTWAAQDGEIAATFPADDPRNPESAERTAIIDLARGLDPMLGDTLGDPPYVGKYEGTDALLTVAMSAIQGHGVADEQCGSVDEIGCAWRLGRFVAVEDSQGFVGTTYFAETSEAEKYAQSFELPSDDDDNDRCEHGAISGLCTVADCGKPAPEPKRDPTCAERIEAHKNGRLRNFGALNDLASVYDQARLDEVLEDSRTRAILDEIGADPENDSMEDIAEKARERISEYPLGVSSNRVFRIDLSTGGPADWLEVSTSGDTPCYESANTGEHYEITDITYHFADWFDHAETELSDDDLATAEDFAREVIPELMS